jgi:hypothetical protein
MSLRAIGGWRVVLVAVAVGCGGKAEIDSLSAAAGGGGQAGASGAASGEQSGASSTGGSQATRGSGGAAVTADSGCAAIVCEGETGDCIPGYAWQTPAGACCPRCSPELTNDCAQGQANYQQFRQWELESNSFCSTDSDCALGYEGNACNAGCGFPIAAAAVGEVDAALKEYASDDCSTCPPQIGPPCVESQVACVNRVCVSGSLGVGPPR